MPGAHPFGASAAKYPSLVSQVPQGKNSLTPSQKGTVDPAWYGDSTSGVLAMKSNFCVLPSHSTRGNAPMENLIVCF